MPDVLFILVLALVIFGPKKLPEIMRQVAKFVAQFRMMRDDLKRQIESEMLNIELEEKKQKPKPAPAAAPGKSGISPRGNLFECTILVRRFCGHGGILPTQPLPKNGRGGWGNRVFRQS